MPNRSLGLGSKELKCFSASIPSLCMKKLEPESVCRAGRPHGKIAKLHKVHVPDNQLPPADGSLRTLEHFSRLLAF